MSGLAFFDALAHALSRVNWGWLLVLLDALFILMIIFAKQRSPEHAVAWVLAVICFPVVGIIFYLFLGRKAFPYNSGRFIRKQQYDDALTDSFYLRKRDFKQPNEKPAFEQVLCTFGDVVQINQNCTGAPLTQDNRVTLLDSAYKKFTTLLMDIQAAKHHIHLLYFIYRDDAIGHQLTQALAAKAREGVKVRLLLDSWGSSDASRKLFDPLVQAGGRVCRYPRGLFQHLITVNFRNHRKIVVIDGRIGYTGGINVGDEYLGKDKRYQAWRDTHLRIQGSAVHMLQLRFAQDWAYASDELIDPSQQEMAQHYYPQDIGAGTTPIQVVSSGPDSKGPYIKYGMMRMIGRAGKSVYIQTPYLIPDQPFLEAVKMAAASGVDVRIMLPGTPDHWYIYYAGLSYVRVLMDMGVRIYLYNGMIHAKTIVVDGQAATVGSTNICNRSFVLNYETNAFVFERDFAAQCEQAFLRDIEACRELLPAQFARRPLWQRAAESVCRLISPLL